MGFWGDIFKPTPQPEVIAKGVVVAWRVDHELSPWSDFGFQPRPIVDVKLLDFGGHVSLDVTPEMFEKIRHQQAQGKYSRIDIVLMPPKEG